MALLILSWWRRANFLLLELMGLAMLLAMKAPSTTNKVDP
jgi:hypothetical protein